MKDAELHELPRPLSSGGSGKVTETFDLPILSQAQIAMIYLNQSR